MKRLIIIIVNCIILAVLWICCEFYFHHLLEKQYNIKLKMFPTQNKEYIEIGEYPPVRFHSYNEKYSEKLPILLIGCSYTFGEFIPEEQNFSSQLINATNRWVYNMGNPGQGPIYSLILLETLKKESLITKEPELIIYTYMFHHIQRWSFKQYYNYYRKHNYIPFQKYNLLYRSNIYKYFKDIELEKYYSDDENFEKRLDLFFKIFNDMKKITDEMFPNSKFVVLMYSDINYNLCDGINGSLNNDKNQIQKLFDIMYSNEFKQRLESMGMTVVSTEDLIGRKMDRPDDRAVNDPHYPHPSPDAWRIIVPSLIKKFNL